MFPAEVYSFLVFLAVSLGAFLFCQHTKLSVSVGYLLAGMLLGPSGFGYYEKTPFLQALGDLGILLFLFTVGLEIPLHRLKILKRYIFGLGLLQVAITSVVLVLTVLLLCCIPSLSWTTLWFLAIAFSFSSTAIIVQLLSERFELTTLLGRSALGTLLSQDIIAIGLFIFLGLQEQSAVRLSLSSQLFGCLLGIGLTGIALFAMVWILKKSFIRYTYSEFTTVFILIVIISFSLLTDYFHLSAELGAFLAGMAMAGSHWRHQINLEIHPFRTIFMAIFFMVMGLDINTFSAFNQWWILLQLLAGLFVIKFFIGSATAWVLGLGWKTALPLGILISSCGEFLFMIMPTPFIKQQLGHEMVNLLLVTAFFSMIITPFLFLLMKKLVKSKKEVDDAPKTTKNHIIISGFGHVGQTIARILEKNFVPFLVVDYDALRIQKAKDLNYPVIHGDARDIEFLKKIGVQYSRVLLITFGHINASVGLVRMLRKKMPHVSVCVQVRDYVQANRFAGLGAHVIVPERIESGIQMASLTLQFLGFSVESSQKMVSFSQNPTFFTQPKGNEPPI